jgi:hypothetical protein
MSSRFQRGAGNLDGILIIAFLILILVIQGGSGLSLTGKPSPSRSSSVGSTPSSRPAAPGETGVAGGTAIRSAGYPSLSISAGNARSEIQPYREYIVVSNWGKNPVDITGWTLRNGKDKRVYYIGNQPQRFSADIAVIGKASPLLLPQGGSAAQNIVLKHGERAVITTGLVGNRTPYSVTSFKENSCTGYLERLDDYNFQPALQTSCPDPEQEPGFEYLDPQCRAVVERLSPCETPEFEPKDREGNTCENCLDGRILSSSCAAYLREHFSYQGCLANHAGDADFTFGNTWRVYLGRTWEMWGKNYESIELYDAFGNLAAFVNY